MMSDDQFRLRDPIIIDSGQGDDDDDDENLTGRSSQLTVTTFLSLSAPEKPIRSTSCASFFFWHASAPHQPFMCVMKQRTCFKRK